MAVDAFLYFPGQKIVTGETMDDDMAKLDAFEIESLSISATSKSGLGSGSGGAGAGKAEFEDITFEKRTDTGSCGLYAALCAGRHFDEAIIELRRSGGSSDSSGATFMKFHFKTVFITKVEWTVNEEPTESIGFAYGAVKIEYFKQDNKGKMTKASGPQGETQWNRQLNKASY